MAALFSHSLTKYQGHISRHIQVPAFSGLIQWFSAFLALQPFMLSSCYSDPNHKLIFVAAL